MPQELLIMRHAKSAWNTNAPSDFHRGLSPRGRNAAALIGHWLTENDAVPDRVIASSAVRVIETLDIVVKIANVKAENIKLNRSLYATTVDNWVENLRTVPNGVKRVLICGHNPELEALSEALCCNDLTTDENSKLMPTATVIRLSTGTSATSSWSHLSLNSLELVSITRPRQLQVQ